MKKAFISYRRQDTQGYAHSLYDRLRMNFNNRQIFMDVDDIKPGQDFTKILQDNLRDCVVLIVVIGKQWVNIENGTGQRRLDNPADFVRIEVATALERGIPVIPVLVNGAPMPTQDELPDNLKALVKRQAVVMTGISYEFGIEQLVSSIERYFGSKRRGREATSTTWYKSAAFKATWMTTFGFLALAVFLADDEETQGPSTSINSTATDNFHTDVASQIEQISRARQNQQVPSPTTIRADENTPYQLAKVMKPPSNIRVEPNGLVICQATSSSVITVIRDPEIASNGGRWYPTNFCGPNAWGFIHESQIRLRK